MLNDVLRISAAVAAAVALNTLGVTAAGAAGPVARAHQAAKAPGGRQPSGRPAPGSQLWASRLSGPRNVLDRPSSLAVSPDGKNVFVATTNQAAASGDDYATVAYNTATGARLWIQRYNGPANHSDVPTAVAVSPTGTTLFVTGLSETSTGGADYATIAYNTTTGAQLWVTRYHGPGRSDDEAKSVAVSPAGTTVFVTGSTTKGAVTAAYNAATGAQLWVKSDPGHVASSVAVGPDGKDVFITGNATVAYRATTGAELWAKSYRGRYASSIALSPDGANVFVTGVKYLTGAQSDYITIGYRAGGTRLWTQRYSDPAHYNAAAAVGVSPNGATVFVTGQRGDARGDSGFATIAYRAATGAPLWTQRYNQPVHANAAMALAVSPASGTVYVTGGSETPDHTDVATVAYGAADGARLWVHGYDGPAHGNDYATSVAVSPNGTKVFTTGPSWGGKGYDNLTIAYQG
jgi:DNA-binding beta-propeller fold protein YncE